MTHPTSPDSLATIHTRINELASKLSEKRRQHPVGTPYRDWFVELAQRELDRLYETKRAILTASTHSRVTRIRRRHDPQRRHRP
jgi:hypothetical protein